MLNLLRQRSFEAEVVCPQGGYLERELRRLNIKVHHLEFGKYSIRQNPLWHIRFFQNFRKILTNVQPNVVVQNLDGNTPHVTLALIRSGVPLVRYCRFEVSSRVRWLDRLCYRNAAAIICPSEAVRNQILTLLPTKQATRVHHLHETCSSAESTPEVVRRWRTRLGLGDACCIGYVGRLHRGKRIEVAIAALALIRATIGNAKLLIVGSHNGSDDDRNYKQELDGLAHKLGVADSVVFTGYIDASEIPTVMAVFDVCVLPSESESFGMVLIEAWAQAVPSVASDIPACREITLASGGGLLAPVGDAQALADQLTTILHEESLNSRGQQAQEWVRRECHPRRYAECFLQIIRSCL